MVIHVKLFARARDLAGADALRLTLDDGACVAGLRRELARLNPRLGEFLPRCAVAVDGEFAADDAPLWENAEVALLPPVSGG